jgi:hypothetical protein
MQLIQIGGPVVLTIQQLIEQMAAQQSADIETLKQTALEKNAAATRRVRVRRRCSVRRVSCKRPLRKSAVQVSVR